MRFPPFNHLQSVQESQIQEFLPQVSAPWPCKVSKQSPNVGSQTRAVQSVDASMSQRGENFTPGDSLLAAPVAVIILDPSGEKLAFTTAPRCLFRTCLHVPSIIHTSMSSVRNYECWSVSRKPAPARRQLRFQSVESTPALYWKQRKGSCRMVLPSNGKLPPQKKKLSPVQWIKQNMVCQLASFTIALKQAEYLDKHIRITYSTRGEQSPAPSHSYGSVECPPLLVVLLVVVVE